MKNILIFISCSLFLFCSISCNGQISPKTKKINQNYDSSKPVGGPFENAEFMYIGMPKNMNSIDTSAGWNQVGQKLLITGTIFQKDGKTPAPNIILYYYHTDIHGLYSSNKNLDKRVLRHGYIRGWVKSDEQGKYKIYTVRPAHYPGLGEPAHIHPSIKEPDMNEYWIDAFIFEGDSLLTNEKRKALRNRGGNGVLEITKVGNLQIAKHDIILGLNIPNYPK